MWASGYIKKLQEGQQVEFRPWGNSMKPLIESGNWVDSSTAVVEDLDRKMLIVEWQEFDDGEHEVKILFG